MRTENCGNLNSLGTEWAFPAGVIWEEERDNPADGPEEKAEEEGKCEVAFFLANEDPDDPVDDDPEDERECFHRA